jgi:hypothetical protein
MRVAPVSNGKCFRPRIPSILSTCVFLLFLCITASVIDAQTVSTSVRNHLIVRVLADFPDQGDCLKDMTAQEQAAFRNDSGIDEIDLDHDGKKEYRIFGSGSCACGAQNCSIWIYRRTANGLEPIFDSMGVELRVSKTAHNFYDDLVVNSHDSASTQYRVTYAFDGRQYHETKSEFVNLETKEVKPTEVQIHFPKGTTSTTLSGRVSIGFGDTYTLAAREGQTMKVEFPSRKTGLTLMIYDLSDKPVTNEWVTHWEGSLGSTGKYKIMVNSDSEKPVAYNISVTIR